MGFTVQPSLLDGYSAAVGESGLAVGEPAVRHHLERGAWVDVAPGWCNSVVDLFAKLHDHVPWRAERRQMYERVVDVPRLVAFYSGQDDLPDSDLVRMREALNERYEPELGEPLVSAGLCLYRDGSDSVAWHGDTIGRGRDHDTVVAIVSLGAARPLLLRPRSGGPSKRFVVGHGDLLVMGGSCQRTWEHAVPKSARPLGPRISIQFGPAGVR